MNRRDDVAEMIFYGGLLYLLVKHPIKTLMVIGMLVMAMATFFALGPSIMKQLDQGDLRQQAQDCINHPWFFPASCAGSVHKAEAMGLVKAGLYRPKISQCVQDGVHRFCADDDPVGYRADRRVLRSEIADSYEACVSRPLATTKLQMSATSRPSPTT